MENTNETERAGGGCPPPPCSHLEFDASAVRAPDILLPMSEWLIHEANGLLFVSLFVSANGNVMWEMIDKSKLPDYLILADDGKYAFDLRVGLQRVIADKESPSI